MLRVSVLGELQLERDGVRIEPPARRPARALLGWLALHPGMHTRSIVAARLWPSVLDESARTSLRTALSALRAVIGVEGLPATREQIGLADGVWVDAREFVRLLDAGRLDDALALCNGELLAEFDEDWVLTARDAHRERVSETLATMAADAADRGSHDQSISLARRRAALDPLDEPAHRELMQLLARAGDRAGALTTYERFAERLRRELGAAPATATRLLASECRRGGPRVAAVRLPLPARIVAARARGPLIGRDAELARLHAAWAAPTGSGRRLTLVSGEPGIGKTRLVAEFAAQLAGSDVGVLYGRAEEEALVPYQPVVESLRDPLRDGVELPLEAGELSTLLPELAHGDSRPAGSADSPPGARLRLFEAVSALLDAVAAGRQLLLVLDDLHWAERPTIRLLHHLAARPHGAPRMIVATYRDTETHPLAEEVANLYRELAVQRIELGGLGQEAVAALLGSDRTAEAVERFREHTGGNPFFIEQLLPGDPAGVTETVSRRVRALGAEAHAVLDAAAVSGAEFELAVVAEVIGLPVDDTLDVLDAAVRARLISEVPDEPGRYAFVHAIVRDTLAGALTAARRVRLHELFAAALEDRAERQPERYLVALANHGLEAAAGAGDPVRASELAQQAANRAGAVLAYEDAAALLGRAAAMLERRGDSIGRRAELHCARGELLQRAGLGAEAGQALAHASTLAAAVRRTDLIARSALGMGGAGVTILGTDPELSARLQQGLAAIGEEHRALRVRLLARLAIELAYDPDPARRDAISREALDLAHRINDPAAVAAALSARHVTAWGPDGCEERLRVSGEMFELAERGGDRELALQARNWRIVDLLELGDGAAVRVELDQYAELAAQVRLPAFAWYVPLWRATLALLEGRLVDGIELSRRALELGRQAGDANAEVFYAEQYLERMLVQGRIRDLDPTVGGMVADVADRAISGPAWRAYRFTFAWWHAERGELNQAREDYQEAVGDGLCTLPRDVNWLAALSSAVEAAVLLGDGERGTELYRLLEPYTTRMVVTARGASHGGSVAYFAARAASLSADPENADRLFAEAIRADEHLGAPALVIRDLHRHGELLHSVGQHDRAIQALSAAAELAGSLGLSPPQNDLVR